MFEFLFSPDFQLGFIAGGSTASIGFLAFVCLAEVIPSRDQRRASRLDQVEHRQRLGDSIRYGEIPAQAANDEPSRVTLDLRDAHRTPRTARSELRSGPR